MKEAAIYLGKCERSVRELFYGRELPGIQKGDNGKIFFDIHDLDAWIEKNKRTA
ncbi:MAG: helix-turn-helix domain-containing protein [Planctomycetota bacterium]